MIKQILIISLLLITARASAQNISYNEQVAKYINDYKKFAEAEQLRCGIPASITLGQGILETQAGQSELALIANNHFGIKCRKEWKGETFAHDDDAPQECFRKYPSAFDSYKDHGDYLRSGTRYQSCFAQNPADYISWAKELRRCGYATNPNYASQLIKIIEDFHLQDYTIAASNGDPVLLASAGKPEDLFYKAAYSRGGDPVPDKDTPAIAAEKIVYGTTVVRDGVKGFYAHKGDVLLEYAIQYKMRYARLLEINGLPDAPLASDMFIALDRGTTLKRILSQDESIPSQTALAPPISTPAIPATAPAPAITEAEHTQASASNNQTFQRAVDPIVATAPQTAATSPEISTPAAPIPTEKPFNIANEQSVEETKPIPKAEEPKDDFSRLKARFDKVVYAPAPAKKTTASAQAPVAAPKSDVQPEKPISSIREYHTVVKGETAFGIAKRYGITMKELMTLNNLDFDAIKIGQKLRVK